MGDRASRKYTYTDWWRTGNYESAMEGWSSREPIVLKVLQDNETKLLFYRGVEVFLQEHINPPNDRELRSVFRCRRGTGEWKGYEHLPQGIKQFLCTQPDNLDSALWIVRPNTLEQHRHNI